MRDPKFIRNIAIIAHIDHGKTTLLDAFLKQSALFRENQQTEERMMDSYDQEKERGITIFSKHTALDYGDYRINIIDTPGHADFSGEVERVLGMVDSVLLIVDAREGPMPQTRFVLSKALSMGLKPIVVLNKIDRPHADPDRVLDETFDLFTELGATDEQLDFAYCYASALQGYAMKEIDDPRTDMRPLFELVIDKVTPPAGEKEGPFLMQTMTLHYDDFLGRQATGQIKRGSVKKGQTIVRVDADGKQTNHQVTRVQGYLGLQKIDLEEGSAGDIVCIAGIPEIMIGDTLSSPENIERFPPIALEEPTLSVDFMVNSSPLAGKEGAHVTMNKIRDRLLREKRANISLKIEDHQDSITVSGRGELHLAVLIEAMRREGFELSLSKPRVIVKEVDGQKHEPLEQVHIEVPEEYSGTVIEELAKRKGEMQALRTDEHGITYLEYLVPTRGLMGYRNHFLTMTRGLGILTSIFDKFVPWKGSIPGRMEGVLVSMCSGAAVAYALFNLQSRGSLFVAPTEPVYEGMIVGEHNRDNDLVVNPIKGKQLTNVRASGSDENVQLTPPRKLTLEQAIDYIEDDEWVEVTPQTIRLRKRLLKEHERKRSARNL